MTLKKMRFARFIHIVWSLFLLAGAMSGTGCSSKPSDRDLVLLGPDQATELVAGKRTLLVLGSEEAVWVDARSESDFRTGHIPGAISLPYERVSADHKQLDDYDILIVYGNDYNDPRSVGMSKRLMELGHKDVRTLQGGFRAWKEEGNPIEPATE
ncbi:MAG: rhodanese-like domain-containing protein [Phycisphaerales bacterium]|nr:rhodanese-like domain-containing protein [Phycisphaerales bacterium]